MDTIAGPLNQIDEEDEENSGYDEDSEIKTESDFGKTEKEIAETN
jgi:hypothetical protein